jgi:hypothetical protein
MRERLIEEDLVYGEYNPEVCPNLQMVEDPFCVPGGRLFGECGPMWCQPCHAFLGPWGAWRAGLAVVEGAARHANEMGNLKRIARAIDAVCAVGWLP